MNANPALIPLRAAAFAAALLASSLPAAENSPAAPAATPDLRTLLRDALFEEEATRDLNKAAAGYEALLTKWSEQRQFAAAALFRLAEVRRKQDRKDDAVKLYQRLLTEFSDVAPHARLSRENLTALGVRETTPPAPAASAPGDPQTTGEESAALARVQKLAAESPDLLNNDEMTNASENGWVSVLKFLHSKGVKDNGKGLSESARAGHLAVSQELLAQAPPAEHLAKAVEFAASNGRVSVLKLLLEKGASPDGPADTDFPPLAQALRAGNAAVIDVLLTHKANVNLPKASVTPLFTAARKGDATNVKRLLELGADAKRALTSDTGPPPPPPGQPRIVLPQGSRVTLLKSDPCADKKGSTPLHAAALSGSVECASLLLKAGADVNAVNESGMAPLHGAAQSGDAATIEMLLAAGAKADGNAELSSGNEPSTPLYLAVSFGNIEAAAALLKGKANPNTPYHGGSLAAIAVALKEEKIRDGMLALLLANGADPSAGTWSAIDAAPIAIMVKLLRSHQYPKLAAKPEVTLVFGDDARETVLAPRRSPDEKPAALPSLLLAWHDRGGWKDNLQRTPDWSAVRLFRKGEDGEMTETMLPVKTGTEFPGLLWGDVIEVVSKDWSTTEQAKPRSVARAGSLNTTVNGLPRETLAILRDTQTAHIKLTANGITRDLTLRGSLRTWNPLSNEAPLVPLSVLAGWCAGHSPRVSLGAVVTLRVSPESGGGDGRYLITDATLAALLPRDGDEITLLEPEKADSYIPRIGFSSPQQQFGGFVFAHPDHTLLRLLAEIYAAPPAGTWPADAFAPNGTPADPAMLAPKLADRSLRFRVLPHPDLSRIRILRGGQPTDHNLLEAAAALPAAATAEDARKLDVPLTSDDRVEIPLFPEAGQPFTALPEKVERLISLAVSCRVNLDDQKGDLRAVDVQWLPARYVETPAGLLPVPSPNKSEGLVRLPTVTAPALVASLFGDKYKSGNIARGNSRLQEGEAGWLREGDRITLSESQQNFPGRVHIPTSTPGVPLLPANTTRIP